MKALLILSLIAPIAFSGEHDFNPSLDFAQVTYVEAKQNKNKSWCFNVSVHHNDQGWKHYADVWEVVDLQGNVIAQRVLAHPHDNEQPFTRGKCNIQIPSDLSKIKIQAQCKQHGLGGKSVLIDFAKTEAEDYSIIRDT